VGRGSEAVMRTGLVGWDKAMGLEARGGGLREIHHMRAVWRRPGALWGLWARLEGGVVN
jgi:hypothetical protein